MAEKIEVQNINTPGKTSRVDKAKYDAMYRAMMRVLPQGAPGLTAAEVKDAAKAHLPDALFPGGATSGWWVKCVQLDLEAKGVMQRFATKPLTFAKT
ncbi:MAG: DUF6958 family protein [Maritimibacter sp.]